MEYIGKVCPYCKGVFEEKDDVVECSVCHVIHHKTCWEENEGCTSFGCSGTYETVQKEPESEEPKTQDIPEVLPEVLEEVMVEKQPEEERENFENYCLNCGAARTKEQKFCPYCGTNFYADSKQQQDFPQAKSSAVDEEDQMGDMDLQMLIEVNVPYYISRLRQMNEKKTAISWNWCSAFFFFYWSLYRKMYVVAVVYFLICLVGVFLPFGAIVLFVCGGLFGNYFYKQQLEKWLREANTLRAATRREYLQRKGGTSGLALALGIIVPILLWIFIMDSMML